MTMRSFKALMELQFIQLLGILICVMRNHATGSYSAFYDLLFQNTSRFNAYNLPVFSVIHLVWFLIFELAMMRNTIKQMNDSKGMFAMEIYRSNFLKAIKDMLSNSVLHNVVILTGVFCLNLITFYFANGLPHQTWEVLNTVIYLFRQLFWLLFLGCIYFIISVTVSDQAGVYMCSFLVVLSLLTDTVSSTSLITYTDQWVKNVFFLLVLLIVSIGTMHISTIILRKGKDI
jgi:hypothetical protein